VLVLLTNSCAKPFGTLGTLPYLARETFFSFEKTLFALKSPLYRDMPRRRKKSIYKSAIINKKRYYFYSIKWVDITGDAAHATVDEFDRFMPSIMITQAYVYKKDKKHLWTFSSYDQDDEVFSDRNVFPLGVILKMEKVRL
jgi:hypothetical protein